MISKFVLSAVVASGLAFASLPTHAHGVVAVGIGVPGFVVAPAPVYAPPPVIVAPRVYAPEIAYGPGFYYRGWGPGWYHDGFRGWDHRDHGWVGSHGPRPFRR